MVKGKKHEDLAEIIKEAAIAIKANYPQVTEEQIYDAIVDHLSTLASNPTELICKLNLPTTTELSLYSRKERYKLHRSKLKSKRQEEVRSRFELITMLMHIKEQMDEDGEGDSARIFANHIVEIDNAYVKSTSILMQIDSDINCLLRDVQEDFENEKDIDRIFRNLGCTNAF